MREYNLEIIKEKFLFMIIEITYYVYQINNKGIHKTEE